MLVKRLVFAAIGWCFSVLLLCGHAVPAHAESLQIVTGEWPPYVSEEMQLSGPAADIVRRAFANSGVQVTFTFYPWKRCERMVEAGDVFGAFPYVKTDLRNRFASYSDMLFLASSYFFYMKSHIRNFDYKNVALLKDYAVGGALGFNYIEPWTEAGVRLYVAPDEVSMFRMLKACRVDLVPGEEHTSWNLIQKLFPDDVDDFAMASAPFGSEENYLMVSKNFPNSEILTSKFNAGLRQLKESGEYDNIWKRYFARH